MTRFLDGPAAGVVLILTRSPRYLRVVRTPAGEWDALDQPADTPSAGEVVHAYQRAGPVCDFHVSLRDKQGRRRGVWGQSADYRYVQAQPPAGSLADTAAWQAWCLAAELPAEGGGS